jgi:hypothetical protein
MGFGNLSRGKGEFLKRPLLSLSSFVLAIAVGIISSFIFSSAFDMARSAFVGKSQIISGLWRGHWKGIPAVTIKLERKKEQLSGTASFKRVVATESGARVMGESPEIPLINPRFDGKSLLFELRAMDEIHPPTMIEMEMRFENDGEAVLHAIGREAVGAPDGEIIKMKRERSF